MDCIMAEERNKVNAGIADALMVQGGLSTQPIYRFGSEEQKKRFLILALIIGAG
jgi:alkylation response protein AidB-like acyl-CoA dehydrogenase